MPYQASRSGSSGAGGTTSGSSGRQPTRNPDGSTTYYPENKDMFTPGGDIWSKLNDGAHVTLSPAGFIVSPASTAPASPTPPRQFGPPTEDQHLLDQMRQPDQPQEVKDFSQALEGLLRDPETVSINITADDLKTLAQPKIDFPQQPGLRARLPGDVDIPEPGQPGLALNILDGLTGYRDMFSGVNEKALMAWIAFVPMLTISEVKALAALAKAISSKTFIQFANRTAMRAIVKDSLAEAQRLGQTKLAGLIENIELMLNSGRYITLAEMKAAADLVGDYITKTGLKNILKGATPKLPGATTRPVRAVTSRKTLDASEKLLYDQLITKGMIEDGSRIVAKAGLGTTKAVNSLVSKTPPSAKAKSLFGKVSVAAGLLGAYIGQVLWGAWALTEAPEPYGFTAVKLIAEDPEAAKRLLEQQEEAGATTWPLYIPLFGALWAFLKKQTGTLDAGKAILESQTLASAVKAEKPPLDPADFPESGEYKIIQVLDGDTVHAYINNHRVSVRLVGINTPERGESNKTAAKQALENLVTNETVIIKFDPANPIDTKWNRGLGVIHFNGQDINLAMVRAGWASTDFFGPNKFINQELYRQAEALAKAEGRGIWAGAKQMTISNIKAQYKAGILSEIKARILLDNLLITGQNQDDYIRLWNLSKKGVETMPTTTDTAAPAVAPEVTRKQELYDLNKDEQIEIIRRMAGFSTRIPRYEKQRVELILKLEAEAKAKAASPAAPVSPTQTAPPAATPAAPSAPPPPLTPPAPAYRNRQTGIKQADANSPREIELWFLNKPQQEDLLRKFGFINVKSLRYEQDRVRKIMELEMNFEEAQNRIAGVTTPTQVGEAPKTLTELRTELAKVKTSITKDNRELQRLKGLLRRYMRNAKQNSALIRVSNEAVTEIENRLKTNQTIKDSLQNQVKNYKVPSLIQPELPPPAAPVTPTPAAPSTTGQPDEALFDPTAPTDRAFLAEPFDPSTQVEDVAEPYVPGSGPAAQLLAANTIDTPPSGLILSNREKELWQLTRSQQINKLRTLGVPESGIPADSAGRISLIVVRETTAPAAPAPATTTGTPRTTTGGTTTYFYDPNRVFTKDERITRWTDQGYQVTVDENGNIIEIWNPGTGEVFDENGNLLGRRNGYYGRDGITAYTPIAPTTPAAAIPEPPAETPVIPPVEPDDEATTYHGENARFFTTDPHILFWTDQGYQVTVDENGNIIDIWNPNTKQVVNTDGGLLGTRNTPYGMA